MLLMETFKELITQPIPKAHHEMTRAWERVSHDLPQDTLAPWQVSLVTGALNVGRVRDVVSWIRMRAVELEDQARERDDVKFRVLVDACLNNTDLEVKPYENFYRSMTLAIMEEAKWLMDDLDAEYVFLNNLAERVRDERRLLSRKSPPFAAIRDRLLGDTATGSTLKEEIKLLKDRIDKFLGTFDHPASLVSPTVDASLMPSVQFRLDIHRPIQWKASDCIQAMRYLSQNVSVYNEVMKNILVECSYVSDEYQKAEWLCSSRPRSRKSLRARARPLMNILLCVTAQIDAQSNNCKGLDKVLCKIDTLDAEKHWTEMGGSSESLREYKDLRAWVGLLTEKPEREMVAIREAVNVLGRMQEDFETMHERGRKKPPAPVQQPLEQGNSLKAPKPKILTKARVHFDDVSKFMVW
jgi:hypothetical protein